LNHWPRSWKYILTNLRHSWRTDFTALLVLGRVLLRIFEKKPPQRGKNPGFLKRHP
jgi:hypothetical protein